MDRASRHNHVIEVALCINAMELFDDNIYACILVVSMFHVDSLIRHDVVTLALVETSRNN